MKTDLKDDNILAKLSQSQLTFVKHHYCLLKYAQVNVLLLSYAKNWEFQAQYKTSCRCSVNIIMVLLFYPTYVRVIMNFYCIIDFILHHNLCTTLRDNVLTTLVNVLEINYIVIIIHKVTSRYIMLLCFINYSCTINHYSQFETTYK